MKTNLKGSVLILFLALVILSSSCASNYNLIKPSRINYTVESGGNEIEFYYKYDVLYQRQNKKYAKKEGKKQIQVVAVSITNNSDRDIKFEEIKFLTGNKQVRPLDRNFVYGELKQNVPIYLLYMLLTPMKLYTSDGDGRVKETPIGFGLGPGITAINMATAGSANSRFKEELEQFDLTNKIIKSGETVYGLVSFLGLSYAPIKIEVNN